MSVEWYKNNKRNYHDILCRIAAYELVQDNISIDKVISKENFDCWDSDTDFLPFPQAIFLYFYKQNKTAKPMP